MDRKKLTKYITRKNGTIVGALVGFVVSFGISKPIISYVFATIFYALLFRGLVILFAEKFSWKKIGYTALIIFAVIFVLMFFIWPAYY